MARVELNASVARIRGKVGQLVFRWMHGQTFESPLQDFSRRILSPKQTTQVQLFREIVRQAKAILADPAQRAVYEAKVGPDRQRLMGAVMKDLFRQSAKAKTGGKVIG